MTTEVLDKLTDALADDVVAKVGPKLIAYLNSQRLTKEPDPLMTVKEIAKELRIGPTTIYQLIETGALIKAPGLLETRVRQSVVNAYGTPRHAEIMGSAKR